MPSTSWPLLKVLLSPTYRAAHSIASPIICRSACRLCIPPCLSIHQIPMLVLRTASTSTGYILYICVYVSLSTWRSLRSIHTYIRTFSICSEHLHKPQEIFLESFKWTKIYLIFFCWPSYCYYIFIWHLSMVFANYKPSSSPFAWPTEMRASVRGWNVETDEIRAFEA